MADTAHEAVTLEPAEFDHLLRLGAEAELAGTQLALAQLRGQHRVAAAQAKHDEYLKTLAEKYPALKPEDAHYKADEATHSLIPQASAEEPPPR